MHDSATAPAKAPGPPALLSPTEGPCPEPKRGVVAWCGRNERPIRRWSLVATNIAQVITLLVVGLWTMHRFKQAEEPGLEPHMRTAISLAWNHVPETDDECEAELSISLENTGKQAINVTEMKVLGWITAPLLHAPLKEPQFISDDELRQESPFSVTLPSGYLVNHFPPGAKTNDTLLFRFKKEQMKRVLWTSHSPPKRSYGMPLKQNIGTLCAITGPENTLVLGH